MAVMEIKSVSQWMVERGIDQPGLVAAARLDERVVQAIVAGRYTPSPDQRQRLCAALAVEPEQIAWGHVNEVEHMYGHGTQFGRSP